MEYRIWSVDKNAFVRDDAQVYMDLNGNVYFATKKFFGGIRLEELDGQYVVHQNTGLVDKYDNYIFEGDVVEVDVNDDGNISLGIMIWADDRCQNVIVIPSLNEYYPVSVEACKKYVNIVGNIMENDFDFGEPEPIPDVQDDAAAEDI